MRAIPLAQLFGVCALALSAAACSDDPRIPDGNHYPGLVVIDDMEDGQQNILSDSGRVGIWYIYSDETDGSTQEPAVGFPMWQNGLDQPARPCGPAAAALTNGRPYFNTETSCKYVARTYGNGQIGFGAGVGMDLNGEGGIKNPIDASAFRGVGFFIRGTARANTVRFNVQDIQTTPESREAALRRNVAPCDERLPLCDDPANAMNAACTVTPVQCNAHYGTNVTITDAWTWQEIPFTQLVQEFGGNGSPIRLNGLVGLQFQIRGADGDVNPSTPLDPIQEFDFSIDNVSFLLP